MNYVGKIFVAVIAVLAIMFATMAIMIYATHQNWREEIMRTAAEVRGNQQLGWKPRLEEAFRERDRLNQEIDKLKNQLSEEKAAKVQTLAKAEATISGLTTENQRLTAANQQLRTNLASATSTLEVTQQNLAHATTENGKLRDDIATALALTDDQIKKATELTDKLTVATGQLEVLNERNQQLATDVGKAKRMLTSLGVSFEDPDDASTIRVAGRITDVGRDRVELSIGWDDGVRAGQSLDIYRGDRYVGRVRVVESRPEKAVAAIETEYQQLPIQRGDNVNSRL